MKVGPDPADVQFVTVNWLAAAMARPPCLVISANWRRPPAQAHLHRNRKHGKLARLANTSSRIACQITSSIPLIRINGDQPAWPRAELEIPPNGQSHYGSG